MSEHNFPPWLDGIFFEKILQRNFKNTSLKVKSVKIDHCNEGKGGFLSQILRVFVTYHVNSCDESKSFIVKMSATNEMAVKKVGPSGYDVQNKEMNFFEIVAPQIEKVLKRLGDENVFAKVVAVDRDREVIIFEDLAEKDFRMMDMKSGLDVKTTEMSLKKMAKFHAASVILHEKHPKVFDDFDVGMFSRKVDEFNGAHESIFKFVVDEVATWPGFEKYADKMEKLKPYLIEKATKCFDVKSDDFCVLNHGDVWKNNFMFKIGENGEIDDAIMIDFQFCHWASPALDLIHFLYTSLNFELYNQTQIEIFIQFYYYELKESLMKLDYNLVKIPTLHQFYLEFLDKLFYGFVYTSNVFPIMMSNDPDNDFIAHHSNDERASNFKKRMVKNPDYQMIMKRMLPVFDEKGILDTDL